MLHSRSIVCIVYVFYFFILGCVEPQTSVKKSPVSAREDLHIYSDIAKASDTLAKDLIKFLGNAQPGYRPRIAVVDFLGPGNDHTGLGRFISQKLITHFVRSQKFERVLERHLLWQLLQQQRFEMTGYYDPKTVSQVAGKIGMQAMVTGGITEIGDLLDINARIVNHDGDILAAAAIQIPKVSMARQILTADLKVLVQPARDGIQVAVGDSVVATQHGIAMFRRVPQGNRSIMVSGYGIEGIQKNIYLNHNLSITVPVALQPVGLTLRVSPKDATVTLDGGPRAPDNEGYVRYPTLEMGEHELAVKAPCFKTYETTIKLNASRTLEINLEKTCAEITLKLKPVDTLVYLDDIPMVVDREGVAVITKVAYGSHAIRLAAKGYVTHEQTIDITGDLVIPFELVKDNYDSMVSHLVGLNRQKSAFNIDLWINKNTFRIGEMISFSFQSSRDCYLTLVDVAADGSISIIYPNRFHTDSYVKAGQIYTIPDPNYGFEFEVQGPPGIERVKAIASEKPFDLFEPDYQSSWFRSVKKGNKEALRTIVPKLKQLEISDQLGSARYDTRWTEAYLEFAVY